MDSFVSQFILSLQRHYSPELLSAITFIISAFSILILLRYFGALGLCVYSSLAVIISNIQVLKMAEFSFCPEPIPLGTVMFATTFLVSDILIEHYGHKAAQQALWLSFFMQIFVSLVMIITLGHPVIDYDHVEPDMEKFLKANDQAMLQLFSPSARILIASLLAYFISQKFDIWVFRKIRDMSNGRLLWLRQNVSTALSGLLDNFIFSLIAWVILGPATLSLSLFFNSFVIASYLVRAVVNIAGTPIMYLSYFFLPKDSITSKNSSKIF